MTTNLRQSIKLTGYIMSAVSLLFIAFAILTQFSGLLTIRDFNWNLLSQIQFIGLRVIIPWLLMSPAIIYLCQKLPIKPENWIKMTLVHFALFQLISLIHVGTVSYIYHYFETMPEHMQGYEPWQHIGHFLFGDSIYLGNIIIYTIFVASLNMRYFFDEIQRKKIAAVQLESQLTQSKLNLLRTQVNPHFLFNTLNVISVLNLKKDHQKTGEMIQRLADFFRMTLEENGSQFVTIEKEFYLLEQYLNIEKVRFGERLTTTLHFEAQIGSALIPSMLLQPLVENAIVHGLSPKESPGNLTIEAKALGDRILIHIEDNGVGCDSPEQTHGMGIGIKNVKQRLQHVYQEQALFSFQGQRDHGVCIDIELPRQYEPNTQPVAITAAIKSADTNIQNKEHTHG